MIYIAIYTCTNYSKNHNWLENVNLPHKMLHRLKGVLTERNENKVVLLQHVEQKVLKENNILLYFNKL